MSNHTYDLQHRTAVRKRWAQAKTAATTRYSQRSIRWWWRQRSRGFENPAPFMHAHGSRTTATGEDVYKNAGLESFAIRGARLSRGARWCGAKAIEAREKFSPWRPAGRASSAGSTSSSIPGSQGHERARPGREESRKAGWPVRRPDGRCGPVRPAKQAADPGGLSPGAVVWACR